MRQFAVILLLAALSAPKAGAQSFLNDLREKKPGQGTVTVTQSPEIDELVNKTKLVRSTPATPKQEASPKEDDKAKNTVQRHEQPSTPPKENRPVERATTAESTNEGAGQTVDTSKKVIRNGRKITGYRVQAYSGGNSRIDRQRAESIGNSIKMRFPDLPVYVHFYSPRWICRVGNFRTFQEANEVLQEIKAMGYRQACIVKGKITVGY